MTFKHRLTAGDTISNAKLSRIFKCATQGGMRRSHRTNSLVMISDHTQFIHHDHWVSANKIHYTGMGLVGNQSIDYRQNKTLKGSPVNGVNPYLFEVYASGKYLFRGEVKLVGQPFEACQPDKNGKPRTVWIFPLKVIGTDSGFKVPQDLLVMKRRRQKRRAQHLSDEDLFTMAIHTHQGTTHHHAALPRGERNVYVAELTKRRANGFCQLCNQPAPFPDKKNEPYLEFHHIIRLSKGGPDSIENCVALCPNCHKKMHILNLRDDRRQLHQEAKKNCCQLTIDGGVVYV